VTRSFVADVYGHMPSVVPGLTLDGKLTGGGVVASGYTGRNVSLDAAAVNALRETLTIGTDVFDAENKRLGTIDAYDRRTGYMRIEKAGLSFQDIFVPVTSVGYLDERGVHLRETKEEIANRFSRLPEIAREYFAA
jgi:hypothetical protein